MPLVPPKPYYTTSDNLVRLYQGDVIEVLNRLPAKSVHMCVTSPPYWGLRDYGEDGQLGLEPTPEEYIEKMVEVFRAVHRVSRDDGTLWLNLGDSYSSGGNLVGIPWRTALALQADGWILRQDIIWGKPSPMPESVTNRCTKAHEYLFLFSKQQRYYYDHEAIKEDGARYEWNTQKFKEGDSTTHHRSTQGKEEADYSAGRNKRSVWTVASQPYPGAHYACFPPKLIQPCILAGTSEKGCCAKCGAPYKRVTEETKLTRERPNEYVKRSGEEGTGNSCANTVDGVESKTMRWHPTCHCHLDDGDQCRNCGASWQVQTPKTAYQPETVEEGLRNVDASRGDKTRKLDGKAYNDTVASNSVLAGKNPCECFSDTVNPCVVLDPFIGSGTTSCVSIVYGRKCVGIDLSEKYLRENAIPRIEDERTWHKMRDQLRDVEIKRKKLLKKRRRR